MLPGGVDSPVRAFKGGRRHAGLHQARFGSHIEDVDGNTYVDYVMSWGPLIHGHAPKGLRKAIAAAAVHGTSFGAPTELETQLAARVVKLVPSMERIRFVSSGTEAAMSALRVARAATGCDLIIKFEGCYHGHADAFSSRRDPARMTLGVPTSPASRRGRPRDTLLARYNDLASVEALFAANRKQIAAVIRRADRRKHGRRAAGRGFLQGLRAALRSRARLLIFDEVISGFRAAPGGAQQLYGIRPDLTCLGKIIGGGLPVGAYGGRADVMELVAPAGPVYQAGTLSGNPLAMTAGLVVASAAVAEDLSPPGALGDEAGGGSCGRGS